MKQFISTIVVVGALLGVSACREEGTMEKAGGEVDEAIDEPQHGDEGTLEKAGRKIDEAAVYSPTLFIRSSRRSAPVLPVRMSAS
jgi:hypothetical protein